MSFHLAQEGVAATWEGVVEELGDAELVARLYDLTDPSREPEVATFSLDELSDDDLPLAKPGAVFYWSIGHRIEPHGQKKAESVIRFRRLPAWSTGDIRRLQREQAQGGDDISQVFGEETAG